MLITFCFMSLILLKGVYSQNSHYGREFVLGMIPAYSTANKIVLDIAAKENGYLYYSIPYLNVHNNETFLQGNTSIVIDSSLAKYGNFTEQRGIYISTDVPVSVIMTSFNDGAADSYLALPVSALGLRYKAASYTPHGDFNAEILIIAAHDDTSVQIVSNDNTNMSFHINRLFVHQISSIKDLSNVKIIASKPVAVISGTICANVPHNVSYCDMILEQMIPVESWSAGTFIVPPFYMSKGFLLKILTNSNSSFCLRNSTRKICNTSRHLPEENFLMGTEPVVVTSSGLISVVQYGLGSIYNGLGDPYMVVIPAIDNYLNEYYFVVPPVYSSSTSYLSVIVPSDKSNSLYLDGSSPTVLQRHSVPRLNLTVLVLNIGIGYHTLKHANAYVKFGALVYGFSGIMGYGFPIGFQFSERHISERTCYSCDDMSHPELCDTVQHCTEKEICYIESYVKSGRKTFRSGCLSSSLCYSEASKIISERCVECCGHDYCNNKGCGESGNPPREQRGPLCYDCHHVWSPDECNAIALCEKGQVCSIEEFKWGDNSHFKLGCSNGLCNPISRSVHMALRSLPVCHHCCGDDYCNTNCTRSTTNEGSVIIG